jgi:tetratricopeptide (TPR) repeat protein
VHLVRTAVVSLGAVIALWGLFGFRFAASPAGRDQFNMPLAEKIEHVGTPGLRSVLVGLAGSHLLPQAYVWGLADVTRTNLEGRFGPVYFLGRSLLRAAPFYYFPVILAVKLPLGLTLLALLGAASSLQRRRRDELRTVAVAVGFAVLFLAVLGSSGSTYAGIRRVLPVVSALAVLAAVAVDRAWTERSRAWRGVVAAAFVGAAVSALPVMRPWEYYNELVGGPANAWRWFGDEGVDMEQRSRETIRLYQELEAAGKRPYVIPDIMREIQERAGLPDAWESLERHMDESSTVTGTFLIWGKWLAPNPWYDLGAFRTAEPVDRRGNLFVFEGSFRLPWVHAIRATAQADRAKQEGDLEAAERFYAEAVELYPQWFPAAIELGNLRAKRGAREEAIRAFETALANAPAGEPIVEQLRRQLERLATEPLEEVAPLRNPAAE